MDVLLVGGYKPLLKALKQGLEEDGFTVAVTDRSLRCDGGPPSAEFGVIVVDQFPPRTPVLPLVQKWRQAGLRTDVLVLTASGESDDAAETERLHLLSKPFPLDDFLGQIRALVGRA